MIGLEKLRRLPRDTRLRKIVGILTEFEQAVRAGKTVDLDYLAGIEAIVLADEELPRILKERFRTIAPGFGEGDLLRLCNGARHDLLMYLGAEPADWDFLVPGTRMLESARRTVLPITLYLDDIRSPFNVGSIFRSSDAFGVSRIMLSEATPSPSHPRARRASMGCTEIVPWEVVPHPSIDENANLFALETGGTPLADFSFPESGTLVVGSEELGVSPELLTRCDDRCGRVSIPMLGAKASLNVGQAVSIVLYRWAQSLLTR